MYFPINYYNQKILNKKNPKTKQGKINKIEYFSYFDMCSFMASMSNEFQIMSHVCSHQLAKFFVNISTTKSKTKIGQNRPD